MDNEHTRQGIQLSRDTPRICLFIRELEFLAILMLLLPLDCFSVRFRWSNRNFNFIFHDFTYFRKDQKTFFSFLLEKLKILKTPCLFLLFFPHLFINRSQRACKVRSLFSNRNPFHFLPRAVDLLIRNLKISHFQFRNIYFRITFTSQR